MILCWNKYIEMIPIPNRKTRILKMIIINTRIFNININIIHKINNILLF